MSDSCVPEGEMRPNRSQPDPLDAVLDGENGDEDLLEVAVLVHDLRAAYRRNHPLEVGPELAGFTGAHLPATRDTATETDVGPAGATDRRGRKRPTVLTAISAFVATLTGKVVLGTAIAAASAGGLHAADVVDLPVLPDSRPSTTEGSTGTSSTDLPDEAQEGREATGSTGTTSDTYAEAMQSWTDCAAEAAPDRDDNRTEPGGGVDLVGACGERPDPAAFGLDGLPDQASDTAHDATENAPGRDRAADTPAGDRPDVTTPDNATTPTGPDPDDVLVASTAYNGRGQVTDIAYGNGVATHNTYNAERGWIETRKRDGRPAPRC
jgi:hypothetical protein